ncbi:hypothetical protein FQN49_000182 [Arthroderma sp. PD_2]|nr:hypothetical protein FQN49_000182 [Arthroderma sp. PD_2]
MIFANTKTIGYKWRSSRWFIVSTISIGLFMELFLYGFLIPLLPYLFRERLHKDDVQTQRLTSAVLTLHGLVSTISGPIIGHFADKMSSRRTPLLLSLVGCIAGTILVAWSPSLVALFLGRSLQGIAGSAIWIVGHATAVDTVSEKDMGKVVGVIMSFTSAGMISGPMVSGILIEAIGYWLTWCVPLGILLIDMIARLAMIENPAQPSPASSNSLEETTPLLPSESDSRDLSTTFGFWAFLLPNSRVMTALVITIFATAMLTSFHATLPLYTENTFGWTPRQVGTMFFLLSVPALFLSYPVGRLRDHIGIRLPVAISLALQAVFYGLVGVAGNKHFPWAAPQTGGPALYMSSILALGILGPFVSSVASIEVTSVVRAQESKTPGIFGPQGGLSRVYAITDVAATTGMTVGPAIAGFLREKVGYTCMNWGFGIVYVILAILAACFLGPKARDAGDSAFAFRSTNMPPGAILILESASSPI